MSTSSYLDHYASRMLAGGSQQLTSAEIAHLLQLLASRVNTLTELRRIEKLLIDIGVRNYIPHLESAWTYYVLSNNLLNELRGLTEPYLFSSACLDEAKALVEQVHPSERTSWNMCYLVLQRIRDDRLIEKHAHMEAVKPHMWQGKIPSRDNVLALANHFIQEWTRANEQLLRHWATPPSLYATATINWSLYGR